MDDQVPCNENKGASYYLIKSAKWTTHPLFQNETIKRDDEFRPLEIHFSANLSWNNHLDQVRTSCARKVGVTLRYKNLLPSSSITPPYRSCMRPTAEYGCLLYAGAPKKLSATLQKIQNRANSAGCASTWLAPASKWKVWCSIDGCFLQVNEFTSSDEFPHIVPAFVQQSRHTRRYKARSNHLKEDSPRTKYFRNSFIRRCTATWNDLSGDIIPANPSVDSFKRRLNRHLKSRGFKTT